MDLCTSQTTAHCTEQLREKQTSTEEREWPSASGKQTTTLEAADNKTASTCTTDAHTRQPQPLKKRTYQPPEWGMSLLSATTPTKEKTADFGLDNSLLSERIAHLLSTGTGVDVEVVSQGKKVVDVLCDDISKDCKEDAFYVVDLGVVIRKVQEWQALLPRVRPHFAIKCCPDPMIMRLLSMVGLGYDCASRGEIMEVMALGVPTSSIIYANPCKQVSMLKWVHENNVLRMTFDNATELHKIKAHCPSAQLILRIAVDDSQSTCKFNSKFGARSKDVPILLREARKLELDVMGVSFHVGSGCQSASVFPDAIRLARGVFDLATEMGFEMTLLDMGGGFPGHDYGQVTFQDIAAAIRPALDEHFPEECGIEMIAEPGRYFVSESHTLATSVIAKRRFIFDNGTFVVEEEDFAANNKKKSSPSSSAKSSPCTSPSLSPSSPRSMNLAMGGGGAMSCAAAGNAAAAALEDGPQVAYYINDGVYGSFNCIMFDHAIVTPMVLISSSAPNVNTDLTPSKLFGPTCDSMDCVMPRVDLPDLDVGDWLYFPNMGAYTRAAASAFNGFRVPDCHYILPRM